MVLTLRFLQSREIQINDKSQFAIVYSVYNEMHPSVGRLSDNVLDLNLKLLKDLLV